jgi:hypothetical protein
VWKQWRKCWKLRVCGTVLVNSGLLSDLSKKEKEWHPSTNQKDNNEWHSLSTMQQPSVLARTTKWELSKSFIALLNIMHEKSRKVCQKPDLIMYSDNFDYSLKITFRFRSTWFQTFPAYHGYRINLIQGHASAPVVSHWLPTLVGQIRSQVTSCGICGRQSVNGADFLWLLLFPSPILIPMNAPHPSIIVVVVIIKGWYNTTISGWCTKQTQSHHPLNKTNLTKQDKTI